MATNVWTKEYWQAALHAISDTATDQNTEARLQHYLMPSSIQITDGKDTNFQETVGHIDVVRSHTSQVKITIVDLLSDGDQLAWRHIVHTEVKDGNVSEI